MMNSTKGQSLTYSRDALLTTIRDNRTKHEAEYGAARAAYFAKLCKELERRLERARIGKDDPTVINLPVPERHLGDYDRAIRMMEMTTQTEISLPAETFVELVMDEWEWRRSYAANTSSYLS